MSGFEGVPPADEQLPDNEQSASGATTDRPEELTDRSERESEGSSDTGDTERGHAVHENEAHEMDFDALDTLVENEETAVGDQLAQIARSDQIEGADIPNAKQELDNVSREEKGERARILEQAKDALSSASGSVTSRLLPALAVSFSVGCAATPDLTPTQRQKVEDAFHRTDREVEQIDSLENDTEQLAEQLKEKVPAEMVDNILALDSVSSPAEREERLSQIESGFDNTTIAGFENADKYPQLSQEDWRLFLEGGLPKGVSHSVEAITYATDPDYTEVGDIQGQMTAISQENGINYFEPPGREQYTSQFLHNVTHEVAHCADMFSNELLTDHERLELLDAVIQRMNKPDSYYSQYIGKIEQGLQQIDEGKSETVFKATEYFAEIFRAYMYEQDHLPEEDKKIVEQFVQKMDPSFDSGQAEIYRQHVLFENAQAYREQNSEYAEDVAEYIEALENNQEPPSYPER